MKLVFLFILVAVMAANGDGIAILFLNILIYLSKRY
jgi:hypothetical protein